MNQRRLGRRPRVAVLLTLTMALTSCTLPLKVAPAQNSADPACAAMMVALPGSLADQTIRETSSQGSAAWGDPASVILRCGAPAPAPTTDPCVTVNNVDWLLRPLNPAQSPETAPQDQNEEQDGSSGTTQSPPASEAAEQIYTAITYGRTPAVELTFDELKSPSATILAQLATAVAQIPQENRCLGITDIAPAN